MNCRSTWLSIKVHKTLLHSPYRCSLNVCVFVICWLALRTPPQCWKVNHTYYWVKTVFALPPPGTPFIVTSPCSYWYTCPDVNMSSLNRLNTLQTVFLQSAWTTLLNKSHSLKEYEAVRVPKPSRPGVRSFCQRKVSPFPSFLQIQPIYTLLFFVPLRSPSAPPSPSPVFTLL